MGKGRPRAVEKGVLGHGYGASPSPSFAALPQAPVFYPTEEEFKDPLEFIYKIRPQAEPFGICRIVPPKSWNPPFALDRDAFSFLTKSQAIHRLQARPPSCDSETFDLEYGRFLEAHLGKKQKRRVVFEGDELDLCRLFNAVKRYGGYDKVCKEKQWGDVARFVRSAGKISECAKHVLSQLYLEHLYDYEEYNGQLTRGTKKCKRGRSCEDRKISGHSESSLKKRRGKNSGKARAKEVAHEALDQICEQCKSGLHGEVMLLCDRCDKGWHLYCLSPPLESVPVGNWYCLECVNSDKDSFGFVPGKRCSLETFRRMDDRTRRKWFGQTNASRVQIEKRFWEIVEGKAGEVEVMYGSDLDTSVYGSGFPRANDPIPSSVDPNAWREYVASPWNLNNFPKLPGSMLQAVHENIAGVMVPWLYVGMLFSSFCWHVEDHCFYSINYLHWGEPKCWYGVPGTEGNAFEQVMRNALPDLFEAQPDLLFQLVTMLNPSVLQENGVPVYGVLQEPGNFVITFPRSYHGGFNFGLNCAEAVNFAPADWLPHGGFGAELYRLYHKAAVLSHEELLYVVSKNGCDAKALPYLEEEMQRVLSREKRCREELWIDGIVRSSLFRPKKHPNYVGTEDDPTCIICQQYLYLSAVTCSCRPSAFVCLEHWKHLCECNTNKHQLLYRHTLAELGDLVRMVSAVSETTSVEETSQSRYSRWHHLIPNASSSMIKKVKGHLISYVQLAEDWLSNSCHILEIPFANSAYTNALKEAEQFLWADHDMDPVRDMVNKLIEAQKWATKVNSCLSKIDDYLPCQKKSSEKVTLSEIEELLSFYPLPCHEPRLTKLKAYAEDARMLIAEIESALSSCLSIGELEVLYAKATGFPIDLEKVGALACVISFAKDWLNKARECLSGKKPGFIEIDFLNKLKSEMRELHVHLPEMDLLSNLCGEAESWQIRCEEILKGPVKFKELEDFLEAADNITVSIPELKLLRQYCCDARSWIFHLHDILQNVNNRRDHGNIVRELFCILKVGQSLRVEVDELPLVEAELKRSSCREKASEALSSKMPLEFLQKLLTDASLLEIENEQLFMEISKELIAAISWEKRAKSLIEHAAQISDFENIIRAAEDIFVILPSLPNVKDALSAVQSWLSRSQPYLERAICGEGLDPLLKVDELKELVSQSKLLKVTSDAPERLHSILKEVDRWEHDACTLLQHSKTLLYMHNNDFRVDNGLLGKIKDLLGKIDSTSEIGRSLGFEFKVLPELKHASLILQWSLTALSFCSRIPLLKEVDSILEDMDHHLAIFSGSNLVEVLIRGTSWLRKALTVLPEPQISKRCKLKDVEQILEEIQEIVVPYPMIAAQLQNAIERHESWIKQAHSFFWLPGQQSWANLLKLKECGQYDALDCPELDKVAFEIEKVEKWMFQCHAVVEPLVGDLGSLSAELEKIKGSLDWALCIYRGSRGCRDGTSCVCCPDDSENKEVYICLRCEDRYHFSCMGPPFGTAGMTDEYSCPFCLFIESGTISRNGGQALICRRNRPELKSFIEFLSVAGDFCAGVKELDLVQEIVNKARDCKSYLTEIVDRAISHDDKDLSSISDGLLSALKAISVAGVYDQEGCCNLESALSRNSWKIRVKKLLRGSEKPVIQQIQRLVKEGLAMSIPSEDHFMKEITEVKQISLRWADIAKQIISDSGEHALGEVFKVIGEGKSLPVHFEKELKLLKARSTLYCICRKPYDQRAMIACDQCDEWYHFDCINLHEPPSNTFYCPACQPVNGEFVSLPHSIYHGERSSADGEPPTSLACHDESKRRHPMKVTCSSPQKNQVRVDLVDFLRSSSEIDHLWRENKRPLQRTARRRGKFGGLSCYSWFQHVNE